MSYKFLLENAKLIKYDTVGRDRYVEVYEYQYKTYVCTFIGDNKLPQYIS